MHHYLAIDHEFRGMLAWFNVYALPGSVYLDSSAYSGGQVTKRGWGMMFLNDTDLPIAVLEVLLKEPGQRVPRRVP